MLPMPAGGNPPSFTASVNNASRKTPIDIPNSSANSAEPMGAGAVQAHASANSSAHFNVETILLKLHQTVEKFIDDFSKPQLLIKRPLPPLDTPLAKSLAPSIHPQKNIHALPPEVLFNIFSKTNASPHELVKLIKVSPQFQKIASNNQLWCPFLVLPSGTELTEGEARHVFSQHPERRKLRYLQIDQAGKDEYEKLENKIRQSLPLHLHPLMYNESLIDALRGDILSFSQIEKLDKDIHEHLPPHLHDMIHNEYLIERMRKGTLSFDQVKELDNKICELLPPNISSASLLAGVHSGALSLDQIKAWMAIPRNNDSYRRNDPETMLHFFPYKAVLSGHLTLATLTNWLHSKDIDLLHALAFAPMAAIENGRLDIPTLEGWLGCHPSLDRWEQFNFFGPLTFPSNHSGQALVAISKGYLLPTQVESWLKACPDTFFKARYALKMVADGHLPPSTLNDWLHGISIFPLHADYLLNKPVMKALSQKRVTPDDLADYSKLLDEIAPERREKIGESVFGPWAGEIAEAPPLMQALTAGQISSQQVGDLLNFVASASEKEFELVFTSMEKVAQGDLAVEDLLTLLFDPPRSILNGVSSSIWSTVSTAFNFGASIFKSFSAPAQSAAPSSAALNLQTKDDLLSSIELLECHQAALWRLADKNLGRPKHGLITHALTLVETCKEELHGLSPTDTKSIGATMQQLYESLEKIRTHLSSERNLQQYSASLRGATRLSN